MTNPDFSQARWRKASLSGDGGCVEVAYADGVIGVRDSKDHGIGPLLVVSECKWAAFINRVRSGEFDVGSLTR